MRSSAETCARTHVPRFSKRGTPVEGLYEKQGGRHGRTRLKFSSSVLSIVALALPIQLVAQHYLPTSVRAPMPSGEVVEESQSIGNAFNER